MKKGDKVMIKDSSWTRSVVDGKLIHEYLAYRTEASKKYTVIETGCSFPNTDSQSFPSFGIKTTFNNTVIQAIDSGKVVFIEERFLRLVEPTHVVVVDCARSNCVTYGEVHVISDKLYKEIKKEQ